MLELVKFGPDGATRHTLPVLTGQRQHLLALANKYLNDDAWPVVPEADTVAEVILVPMPIRLDGDGG